MNEKGKLLEVAGKVVGYVIQADEKTLLVRKGFITWQGDAQVMALEANAVFIDRSLIDGVYWIKFKPCSFVTETVDCYDSGDLIRKFLNVKVCPVVSDDLKSQIVELRAQISFLCGYLYGKDKDFNFVPQYHTEEKR
jgi:hypothetical protein